MLPHIQVSSTGQVTGGSPHAAATRASGHRGAWKGFRAISTRSASFDSLSGTRMSMSWPESRVQTGIV